MNRRKKHESKWTSQYCQILIQIEEIWAEQRIFDGRRSTITTKSSAVSRKKHGIKEPTVRSTGLIETRGAIDTYTYRTVITLRLRVVLRAAALSLVAAGRRES
jgi:hypothetical protein